MTQRVSVFRIEQGGIKMDVGVMSYGQLEGLVKPDKCGPKNTEGYQRAVAPRRIKDLAKYLVEGYAVLPSSILLCKRKESSGKKNSLKFKQNNTLIELGSHMGTLEIPSGCELWIVDGQHRLQGLKEAVETGEENLNNYMLPVVILQDLKRIEEMRNFNTINTMQKKIPTDLVDQHILKYYKQKGKDQVNKFFKDGFITAVLTDVVEQLNNSKKGPWHDRIRITGTDVTGGSRKIGFNSVVASLKLPMNKLGMLEENKEKMMVKLLTNLWNAAKTVWPEAFESPNDYRLQATVGVYVLHILLPDLSSKTNGVLTEKALTEVLKELSGKKVDDILIDTNFWHKQKGHNLTKGTSLGTIRELASELTAKLTEAKRITV